MFVILKYSEGEVEVIGPFDTEDKALVHVGRLSSGDNLVVHGRFFVRQVKEL